MKILAINLGVWPELHKFVSGGEKHFIEICKRWTFHGHEIDVLTTEAGARNLEMNNLYVRTYILRVPYEDVLCKASFGVAIFYLLRLLKSYISVRMLRSDFDVICTVTHFIFDTLPALLISKKRSRPKFVTYAHELLSPPSMRTYHNFLLSLLSWFSEQISLKLIKNHADLIFATPITGKRLVMAGLPEKLIRVIHNAVDLAYIQQVKPTRDKYDACFLGRISTTKGIFDLIDIWNGVCEEIPEARIAIIGGGGEKHSINKFIKKINMTDLGHRVIYIGPVDEVTKYALLKSSKLFVSPSYEEGWGIAICEAMACGLPVIAYDLPSYKYVFKQGIVTVAMGNKKQFIENIIKILNNDDIRRKLGDEAKAQARKYDWDTIAFDELEFMKNLASERLSNNQLELDSTCAKATTCVPPKKRQ